MTKNLVTILTFYMNIIWMSFWLIIQEILNLSIIIFLYKYKIHFGQKVFQNIFRLLSEGLLSSNTIFEYFVLIIFE